MTRRDLLKRMLVIPFVPLFSILTPKRVFASRPILRRNHDFLKQNSPQLDQILPGATRQDYENVTVYSTTGQVSQNTLMRWSRVWDLWVGIFVNNMGWWFVGQIPKSFKVILVSEAKFIQLWPLNTDAGGIYVHPNEVWLKGSNLYDIFVIHETLHRILSWIYLPNPDFSNTRLPGYSPLIINGAEIVANQLGSNPNPMIIDQTRFNQRWDITKNLMLGQGFIGVEEIPAPRVVNCRQNCGWGFTDINIAEYEGWQRYNGTGEIYLGIIMLTAILDHYNFHRDLTGIFDLAVCNAKRILNQQMGRNPGESSFIIFQGQFLSCE